MVISKPGPLILILALVGGLFGCSQEADTEDRPDLTTLQRQMASAEAAEYLIRAQDAFYAGRDEVALALADSAEGEAPNLADVDFLRGLIYSRLGRLNAAQEAYRRALEQDSCYTGGWQNLANAALRSEEYRDALEASRREQSCRPTTSAWTQVGRAYAYLGWPDSARAAYQKALSMDSTTATAHAFRAQLEDESGMLDLALEHARIALRLDEENLDYHYYLGSLLVRTGRAEDALPYLQFVVERRPWHYGAHYNLGQALIRLDRNVEGRTILAKADSLERTDARLVQLVDRTRLYPQEIEGWMRLGEAYMQIGRMQDARNAFRSAVVIDPDNVYLQSNLASLDAMAGHADAAIDRFHDILRRDSTHAEVWLNLGLAYARAGRISEARDAWRAALRHDSDQAQVQALLAEYGR